MRIVIASGKGGVGKSMLASSLSLMFSKEKKIVACDCDVDAPNLGIWLGIKKYDKIEKVSTSLKAFVNPRKCNNCDYCIKICKYGAIKKIDGKIKIDKMLCEGCGLCEVVCPKGAFKLKPVKNGEIRINTSKYNFPIISGKLYPGEHGSGKIVEELKERINYFPHDLSILDAAAGIGCPVIASIRGSDFAILITEPTPSGYSDLKRIVKVVEHFGIPYSIVINKHDINKRMTSRIEKAFDRKVIGKISYNDCVINSLIKMEPVIYTDCKVKKEIDEVHKKLKELLSL